MLITSRLQSGNFSGNLRRPLFIPWLPKHNIATSSSNPFTSNTLLRTTYESHNPSATFALFKHMLRMGTKPNGISFSFAIRALSDLATFPALTAVHSLLLRLGFSSDVFSVNTLVNAFVAVGSIDIAHKLFDELPKRDLISWTVMVNGCTRSDRAAKAVVLIRRMIEDGVLPDGKALVAAFAACARVGQVGFGSTLEGLARKSGLMFDVHVINLLIDMYAKCCRMDDARKLFDAAAEKDVVTWNCMVSGYAKSGNMAAAEELLDRIPGRNEVSWSALINGYIHNGAYREALCVFHKMMAREVEPNNAALTGAIMACGQLGALSLGREIHTKLDEHQLRSDVVLSTALVDMYAKCGCLGAALELFNEIEKKTLVSWNVMIMGMAIHGNVPACFDLFSGLLKEGLRPNSETFTGMLTACAHGGRLEEGRDCFAKMSCVYGILPRVEHCACMVHLIGQSGDLNEAVELIRSSRVTPDVVLWGALLTACNSSGNVKIGEFAAEQILRLDPFHSGAYVQLSSIYAKAKMWKEVLRIRRTMKEMGTKTRPGWSSFESDEAVHQFHAGCCSHPKLDEILSVSNALDKWIQSDDLF